MVTSSKDIYHILFMDDVVMIGEGMSENLGGSEQILDIYKKETRMHINLEKSILS